MERARFIVAGVIGSATKWLAQALRENTSIEPRQIVHEWFSDKLYDALDAWPSDTPLCGSVGHDYFWMEQIQQLMPETKWAFIWRTPIDQIGSMLRKSWRHVRLRSPDAIPGFATKAAIRRWITLEAMLEQAETLGIELTHWHMDYYTTPDGLSELLGTLVPQEYRTSLIALPSPTNVSRPVPFVVDAQTETQLTERFNSFTRVKAAYDAARRP